MENCLFQLLCFCESSVQATDKAQGSPTNSKEAITWIMPGAFQVRTGRGVEGTVGRAKQAVGGVQDEDAL